ncbi:SDR family NAD(P)-dependent oxidoreductase [Denitrobaculum tricleocarpae]|uniref:SDR family NAD(P)-dependent oxidoreductase n=1 Tax=Denitrobaculum tricleocarpae TaxID=2591009 RepID=A0A545TTZ0_9PROT|nr:SDR family NAD(P)-dependent oxidoreductase [Denitrobaculum tricleocarpae]TQV80676.1 SDR family NAD(P)-dependent oxidoreductase [Denitrobaculum tricleocarpae]
MQNPKSILITGASSGIGEALARQYAASGVHLALTGRDSERLEAVASACRQAGADVTTCLVDVQDRDELSAWTREVDATAPLDLVIANAGVSAGTGRAGETAEQTKRIMAVNVDGVFNTILPAVEQMKNRRSGQVAIMSSLAGFRGFPGAPAYCASKAAVRLWGESLRGELFAQGIGVSVICPGFVRSRMTAVNEFPMPFLMDADRAARIIQRGLSKNRPRIAFPLRLYAVVWTLALLPSVLIDPILRRLPQKN